MTTELAPTAAEPVKQKKKDKKPCFVINIPLITTNKDRAELRKVLTALRFLYNAVLNECIKRYNSMRHDKDYKQVRALGMEIRARKEELKKLKYKQEQIDEDEVFCKLKEKRNPLLKTLNYRYGLVKESISELARTSGTRARYFKDSGSGDEEFVKIRQQTIDLRKELKKQGMGSREINKDPRIRELKQKKSNVKRLVKTIYFKSSDLLPSEIKATLGKNLWKNFQQNKLFRCKRKMRFKSFKNPPNTIQSSYNDQSIRFLHDSMVVKFKKLVIHVDQKSIDDHIRQMIEYSKELSPSGTEIQKSDCKNRSVCSRLTRKDFNGYEQWSLQLTIEGVPPIKSKHLLSRKQEGKVSFDLGTRDWVVLFFNEQTGELRICKEYIGNMPLYEDEIKRLSRKMSKSDFEYNSKHNPSCLDEKGRYIKGKKVIHSNHWYDLKRQIRNIERIKARARTVNIGELSNKLLSAGCFISFEKINYKSWQKNFGRSVKFFSPGALIALIKQKAERLKIQINEFSAIKACASQICPKCGHKEKRERDADIHCPTCGLVIDRDLAAAIVAYFADNEGNVNLDNMKKFVSLTNILQHIQGKLGEKSFFSTNLTCNT